MNKFKYAIWWLFYIGDHHLPYGFTGEWGKGYGIPIIITCENKATGQVNEIVDNLGILKHQMSDGTHEKETASANRLHL